MKLIQNRKTFSIECYPSLLEEHYIFTYNVTDNSRELSFKEEIFKEKQIFEEEKATDKLI